MKRPILLFLVCSFALWASGQKYDPIKTLVTLGQNAKAKEELDKNMTNEKFTSKPDAWMLKTAIYAGLAMDNANKETAAGLELANEAAAAFRKFKEMDPSMALMSDPIYQNGPINLYSYYYSSGFSDYTAKKWASGIEKLKHAVEFSDLLISRKIIQAPLDTNVLILAGITAENNKQPDDAARYYSRLADAKIPGEDYEAVYRFLVNYYFTKKDMAGFDKYKSLGKELYPNSEYFNYDKVDFAAGLAANFEEKVKEIEAILANEPNNYKANEVLGEIIYDTLNSLRENAVLPSNAVELEVKMINAFKKAASLKPESELPYIFMGDHFINKAVKVNEARTTHAAEMKARTKPGTMASKEDVAKRDMLDKQYGEALESAREPYEKTAEIFAKKEDMQIRDKQQYKKACNYLADIYAFKKAQSKGKPADQAKYAAEEKKWNDRYDSIK
ncbi:MAG: hypothetical protein ACO25B_08295 [Chitinophagaceae bacterium]